MTKLKMLFSGTMPWEVWVDEHPVETLDIAVLALVVCSFIFR